MAPQNPKPDVKVKRTTLLKVLRPLILLVIPVVLLIVGHIITGTVGFWLRVAAYVLFGGIGIWVAIRLAFYLKEVIALKRQQDVLKKQDPLFIAETRMHERLVKVHNSFKEARMGIYDLPYYLVLGNNDYEFGEIIKEAGLTVPANLADGFEPQPNDLETWNITNDGVFINVSRTLRDAESEPEWEILLKALASDRPGAPISGAIVVLPIDHLCEPSAEVRKERELQLQKRLEKMQTVLQISFPVYLIVTGIDRMTGFAEFFGDMDEVNRDQIFGWSNTEAGLAEFDVADFSRELDKLSDNVKRQEFRRMEVQNQTESLDRVYYFSAEFDVLLGSVKEVVGNIFGPNQFLEPIPLRGFYLTGSMAPLPPVGFELQGPLGECKPKVSDALAELQGERRSWFCKDLFKEKIIAEAGGINRPTWVIKQQKRRKVISAALISLVAILGIAGTVSGIRSALDWSSRTKPTLITAQKLIQHDDSTQSKIFSSMNDITGFRDELSEEGLFLRLWAAGRYERLNEDLGQVHRALFQKRYLKGLIFEQETAFEDWRGDGTFSDFNSAFVEYVRWANPSLEEDEELTIHPFVDYQNVGDKERKKIQANYKLFLKQERGRSAPLVRPQSKDLIDSTLKKINVYLNPRELEDFEDTGMIEGESHWWLRLALALEDFSKTYNDLLHYMPAEAGTSHEKLVESIVELDTKLQNMNERAQEIRDLLREGEDNDVQWISVTGLFDDLENSASDWKEVLPTVLATKESAGIYRERVENPIREHKHLVSLFFNEPGYPELSKELLAILSSDEDAARAEDSTTEDEKKKEQDEEQKKEEDKKVQAAFQSFRVGTNVLQMVSEMDSYVNPTGASDETMDLYLSEEEDLEIELTSDLDTIRDNMNVIRKESKQKLLLLKKVNEFFGKLEELAKKVEKPDDGGDLKKKAIQSGVSEIKNVLGDKEELEKRAIAEALYHYRWESLKPWVDKWTQALEREQAHQTSAEWIAIFEDYSPAETSTSGRSWKQLIQARPFKSGDGLYYVESLSVFLNEWLNGLPQDLENVISRESADSKRKEQGDFVQFYAHVSKLQTEYLPALRGASKKFVDCVGSMRKSASKSWLKLYKTSDIEEEGKGQGPSWGSFEGFSSFKDTYEMEQGDNFATLTDSLVYVEQEAVLAFEDQLEEEFSKNWKKIVKEGRKNNLNSAFPFAELAGDMTYHEMFEFVDMLENLASSYGLYAGTDVVSGEEAESEPLYFRSEEVLEKVINSSRRNFLEKCLAFKKFLVGDEEHGAPEVSIKVVPGEIGRHYHWIRIRMSDGSFYDMNVYGEKVVEIRLAPGMGRIVFQGLSVDKTILAERKVGKGDFGLLQMPYLIGKNIGGKRKIWRIPAEIRASDAGGEMVSFDLEFEFSKALPIIPGWRN